MGSFLQKWGYGLGSGCSKKDIYNWTVIVFVRKWVDGKGKGWFRVDTASKQVMYLYLYCICIFKEMAKWER